MEEKTEVCLKPRFFWQEPAPSDPKYKSNGKERTWVPFTTFPEWLGSKLRRAVEILTGRGKKSPPACRGTSFHYTRSEFLGGNGTEAWRQLNNALPESARLQAPPPNDNIWSTELWPKATKPNLARTLNQLAPAPGQLSSGCDGGGGEPTSAASAAGTPAAPSSTVFTGGATAGAPAATTKELPVLLQPAAPPSMLRS